MPAPCCPKTLMKAESSNSPTIRGVKPAFSKAWSRARRMAFWRPGSSRGAPTSEANRPASPGAPPEVDGVVDSARPGTLLATPLFLALIMVEVTDLIFAVDSIPAIFAITTDPFLVFTSNVFAILGLRSLYFALAGMIDEFRYLKVALAVVLMVVGVKMMTHTWLKSILGEHFNLYLLAVVLMILFAGVAASVLHSRIERGKA